MTATNVGIMLFATQKPGARHLGNWLIMLHFVRAVVGRFRQLKSKALNFHAI